MRHDVLLSGKGGQGIILAGVILAEAAGVGEQREVVQTQVYGPESRGGASRAGVIISDEPILYPEVTHPDVFVALSQEALDRFGPVLAAGAEILTDMGFVDTSSFRRDVNVHLLPFTGTAEKLGGKILANMVALGALTQLTSLVSADSMRAAIRTRTADRFHESNLQAFDAGLELVKGN